MVINPFLFKTGFNIKLEGAKYYNYHTIGNLFPSICTVFSKAPSISQGQRQDGRRGPLAPVEVPRARHRCSRSESVGGKLSEVHTCTHIHTDPLTKPVNLALTETELLGD